MKKRLFGLLMALVFTFSLLPGTVFAAKSESPAEASGGGILDAARGKLIRLSGLTGTETYGISDPTRKAVISKIVTGLKNRTAEIDVSGYGLTVQEGCDLYIEVLDAHYELFYVTSGYGINSSASGITSITPFYDNTYTSSDVITFNNTCSSIVAGIPQGTNAEKLLWLHDYLITHCEYDLTYKKTNAYNALVEGRAVCDGYSKAYKVLCAQAGLTCEFVSSDAINHSWNMVQVNKEDTVWYYIDCTWDDPTNGSSLTAESSCDHKNFLLSQAACAATHKSNDWINGRKESVYDYTTSTKYDSYWWKGLNRPVQWVGTKMCYAKSTDLSHVFFRSSGSSSESSVTIQGGGSYWYEWGNSSSYWDESYITIASDGGTFYYSTPTQIWKLTTGGAMTLAYTLTSAEQKKGYIYGIQCGAGGLTYYIGQDPLQPSEASGTLSIPLAVSSVKADKTSAAVGEAITWTGAASGGSGSLQYGFRIYQDGTLVLKGSYGSSRTVTYTPTAAGTYTAKFYVKDSAGTVVTKTSSGVTVTAAGPTITSVKADKTSAAVGEAITWTGAATGGTGSLQTGFRIYRDGTLVMKGSYGTSRTVTYTPTEAGTYTAKFYVKDSAGTVVTKTSSGVNVTAAVPLAITNVKADKTSAAVGEAITWTGAATGGTGTLQYGFRIYRDGTLVMKGSYGSSKTVTYTPTAAGTYTAKFYVKDSAGTVVTKNSAGVTVTAPLTITSVKADKTTAAVGEAITWTGAATGGAGTLQYGFRIYRDGTLVLKGSYGNSRTVTYTPTEAGTYTAKFYVKDSAGTVVTKKSKGVTVTVPITITSVKANKTTAAVGEAITWTGAATGGTGDLQYGFRIYRDGTLVMKGSYGNSRTVTYYPTEPGTYTAKFYVKDSAGTVVTKTSSGVTVTW